MSGENKTVSRAGALRRMLLVTGGAVGMGATGAKAFAAEPSPVAPGLPAGNGRGTAVRTLVLHGRDWRLKWAATDPGSLPADGSLPTPVGRIVDGKGRALGSFLAATLPASGGALELHTFDLADGTILGIGPAGVHEKPFAIVGGTGRFIGAGGTYVARQSPRELGGDGTAQFTLTLTA